MVITQTCPPITSVAYCTHTHRVHGNHTNVSSHCFCCLPYTLTEYMVITQTCRPIASVAYRTHTHRVHGNHTNVSSHYFCCLPYTHSHKSVLPLLLLPTIHTLTQKCPPITSVAYH